MGAPTLPGRREFNQAEIDQALLTLALHAGNAARAHRDLKASDMERAPSARTLANWRNTPRYQEIQKQHAKEIEAVAVARFRENMMLSAELHAAATRQALDEAEAGELKDAGRTAQSAAIAAGVAADKLLVFTDRPNQITATLSPQEAIRGLARDLGISIDSTAEEISEPLNHTPIPQGQLAPIEMPDEVDPDSA